MNHGIDTSVSRGSATVVGTGSGRVCAGCDAELPAQTSGRHRKWCSERCRKMTLYAGTCADCGTTTSYGKAGGAHDRCRPCASRLVALAQTIWTSETILAAIRDWAAVYGEAPAIPDWNPTQARAMHDESRARRFEDAEGRWPTHMSVYRVFGSWSAAIAEAGFEVRAPHGGSGNQLRRRSAA